MLQIVGDLNKYAELCAVIKRFLKASDIPHHTHSELAKIYGVDAGYFDDDDWELLERFWGNPSKESWGDNWPTWATTWMLRLKLFGPCPLPRSQSSRPNCLGP